MSRAPSLRSLFLTWVCFSLAFCTVFQAFLTTFLIDSGYKTPIQNMDELLYSGITLAYPPTYDFIFDNGDETETSRVQSNRVNCPSFYVCVDWAKYKKNLPILLVYVDAVRNYAIGDYIGENYRPFMNTFEELHPFLQTYKCFWCLLEISVILSFMMCSTVCDNSLPITYFSHRF
jgi:hypothetical protein